MRRRKKTDMKNCLKPLQRKTDIHQSPDPLLMTMAQGPIPIATTVNTTTATTCGDCGIEEEELLHYVPLRGNILRVCTTCVLRLHPHSFCPACLVVHESSPPNGAVVCHQCYSSSHPACVSTPPGPAAAPWRCSACLNPSALVFNPKIVKAKDGEGGEDGITYRAVDKNAASLLLAAAKIACSSMKKAAEMALAEAQRRGKEAACARKRAREALDHVVYLMEKEEERKKENVDGNQVVDNAKAESNGVGFRSLQ